MSNIYQKIKQTKELNTQKLDSFAKAATQDAYNAIDCLSCANCCRSFPTTMTDHDISRISNYKSMSRKAFISKYLILDQTDNEYTTINTPCDFLDLDTNMCSVYEVRPEACASYPHTQRKDFASRSYAHSANYESCPITQRVVDAIFANFNDLK